MSLDLDAHFSDPEGGSLVYGDLPRARRIVGPTLCDRFMDPDLAYGDDIDVRVESTDSWIVRTGLSGLTSIRWLSGVSEGTTTVTVTATDLLGLSVPRPVDATVEAAGDS